MNDLGYGGQFSNCWKASASPQDRRSQGGGLSAHDNALCRRTLIRRHFPMRDELEEVFVFNLVLALWS